MMISFGKLVEGFQGLKQNVAQTVYQYIALRLSKTKGGRRTRDNYVAKWIYAFVVYDERNSEIEI